MSNSAIHILNGPNLNRLGMREPEIYGSATLADIEGWCRTHCGRKIFFRQSNFEGQLVEYVHEAIDTQAAGIVINPAGLSFQSVPLLDALKMVSVPIIELHISNIHRREKIYHHSLVSKVATAAIAGLGPEGYLIALDAMERLLASNRK